jgi:hypothetical protein
VSSIEAGVDRFSVSQVFNPQCHPSQAQDDSATSRACGTCIVVVAMKIVVVIMGAA